MFALTCGHPNRTIESWFHSFPPSNAFDRLSIFHFVCLFIHKLNVKIEWHIRHFPFIDAQQTKTTRRKEKRIKRGKNTVISLGMFISKVSVNCIATDKVAIMLCERESVRQMRKAKDSKQRELIQKKNEMNGNFTSNKKRVVNRH